NQVRRKIRYALRLLLGKPVLDGNILFLNPSKLAQLLSERVDEDRATRSSASIQDTDADDFPRLLRLSRISKSQNETSQCYDKRSFTHQPLLLTWLAVGSYYGQMKKATVSDLKNQISRYLDYVKRGETVLVLDRSVPVAELKPITGKSSSGKLVALERKGLIRLGSGKIPEKFFKEKLGG